MINKTFRFFLSLTVALALTTLTSGPQPARAAGPWYVAPSGDDNNDCLSPGTPCSTINGTIARASSGDTLYVAAGTYTGTGGEAVLIDRDIALSGGWDTTFTTQNSMSIIDGQAARRGITISGSFTVEIERFVVQNSFGNGAGGIYNSGGVITLSQSIVSGNTSQGGGGGISNVFAGIFVLNNSAVIGNKAAIGGGIANTGTSVFNLNNSTISGNSTDSRGGGVYNDSGTVHINSVTISGNHSTFGPGGGGIYNETGTVTAANTIVAGNTNDQNDGPDCEGTITSLGYDLVGNTTVCNFISNVGDLTNIDPFLGSLIGPSGAPRYQPLLSSSPAIDAGNPAGCTDQDGNVLTTDQRGAARVGTCDIGAYEFTAPGSAVSLAIVDGDNQITATNLAFPKPLQVAALDNQGSPVGGAAIDFTAPGSGASGIFTDTGTNTTSVNTNAGGIATASTFTANNTPGTYAVAASAPGLGSVNFNLEQVQRPANDDFDNAQAITALPFSDTVDITNATNVGEPGPCYYFMERTVWYSFTPTQTVAVRVSTAGPNLNRNLNLYRSTAPGIANLIFMNCAVEDSSLTFVAEAGQTYYLQAGTVFDEAGTIQVNLEQLPAPANDDFANATVVPSPLPFDDTVDLSGAVSQAGEPRPSCATNGLNGTVWYAFTPTASGSVSAKIYAPFFSYTVLAAYTGTSLTNLTELGCSSPYGAVLTLHVNAGTTYYFQASNFFAGQTGSIQFHLETTPPPVAGYYYYPSDPSRFDTIQFQDSSYDPGNISIQTFEWDFGDGTSATGSSPTHKYTADGDYRVAHSVTTADGRTASITQTVQVRTHDVAITKIAAPNSANVGQTRTITVTLHNTAYPEIVQVDLYKSIPGGFQWVATLTKTVPALSGNRTTNISFNYTFSTDDARVGKMTFKAVATLVGTRDAFPIDNEVVSSPPTKVTR